MAKAATLESAGVYEVIEAYRLPYYLAAATEALLRVETFPHRRIWEPACGDGAISKVLEAAGYHVFSSDLHDRGYGTPNMDFVATVNINKFACNIVTNPPFSLVLPFAQRAVDATAGTQRGKVALLLRLACLEGQARRAFFEASPLARLGGYRQGRHGRLCLVRLGAWP